MDRAMDEDKKPVYSIFEKPDKQGPLKPTKDDSSNLPLLQNPAILGTTRKVATGGRKAKKSAEGVEPASNETKLPWTKAASNTELLEVDPNDCRMKRQKTTSPHGKGTVEGCSKNDEDGNLKPRQRGRIRPVLESVPVKQAEEEISQPGPSYAEKPLCAALVVPDCDILCQETSSESSCAVFLVKNSATDRPPRNVQNKKQRILRLNPKTGTIGSPPPAKDIPLNEPSKQIRAVKKSKHAKSLVVVIPYTNLKLFSLDFGERIESVMRGIRTEVSFVKPKVIVQPNPVKMLPRGSMKVAGSRSTSAPHPFFRPKEATNSQSPKIAPSPLPEVLDISLSLKCSGSERTTRFRNKPPTQNCAPSAFAGFGRTSNVVKFPGAIEPAWPWQGMVHIRGTDEVEPLTRLTGVAHQSNSRKSKYTAAEVLAHEDIIAILAAKLQIEKVAQKIRDIDPDEYPPIPDYLRVPIKHFEAGGGLRQRIRNKLYSKPIFLDDKEEDDLSGESSFAHPAVNKLYGSIATNLSAFDQAECESVSWNNKYSPQSAAEVLQKGREAFILKEWLQALTVMAVETNSNSSTSRSSVLSRKETAPKRKRKPKKIDEFIVFSDEESEDMDEVSDPEFDNLPPGLQNTLKRTVVRTSGTKGSKESGKFANGVVISGPHGCGKTAAVYAVAKELGFEIFEVNSSSRRSGKDIMEKVGDMTRNHLVQSSNDGSRVDPVDEDAKRLSDALEDDLKSGRQGTMNSFFISTTSQKTSAPPKNVAVKRHRDVQILSQPKAPPRQQKQSLILFEEVDILYEEDKQFWVTVINLILTSKRPVIMTCKDESALPLDALSLHAIIRFAAPPTDIAADHLLLLAANEGHELQRDAVIALYEGRNNDLRASITDLNFWCQFAVGDVKGGLDWFYPRWPRGNDADEAGNTIRVISEGTYTTGMGWYCHDFIGRQNCADYLGIEEEALHEAWDAWAVEAGDWHKSLNLTKWARNLQPQSATYEDRRAMLTMYDELSDSLSSADLCSIGAFASDYKVLLDPCIPNPTQKTREDYILSHEVMEGTAIANFNLLGKDISLWMQSRSREHFQVDQHVKRNLGIPADLSSLSEECLINLVKNRYSSPEIPVTRHDFSSAFDPISEPDRPYVWSVAGQLEASSFDRPMSMIAVDLAPYVRSIVAYDFRLQKDRTRMSNLLSEGGRGGKRMRTTRAAISALEGGARVSTRRDKYFGGALNPHAVLKTGLQSWLDAAEA